MYASKVFRAQEGVSRSQSSSLATKAALTGLVLWPKISEHRWRSGDAPQNFFGRNQFEIGVRVFLRVTCSKPLRGLHSQLFANVFFS